MSFVVRLAAFTILAAAVALAVLYRRSAPNAADNSRQVVGLLGVVAGALLLVGVVSGTQLRHVIQVTPLLLAMGLGFRFPAWADTMAGPLFAFWLVIVTAIWLYLLGVARLVTGRFSPAEIALTILIGAASVAGLWRIAGGDWRGRVVPHVGTVIGFALLQLAAMIASAVIPVRLTR